jgi:TolB-like protein/Tfp pilus assembly protein PilF
MIFFCIQPPCSVLFSVKGRWKSFAKADIFLLNSLPECCDMAGLRSYQFGEFRLDSSGRVLTSKGRTVPLPPKLGGTLLALIQKAGNVVEKQELLRKVWAGEFVEEGSIARTVSLLRNILKRNGTGEEYIVTVPKRGYRFVAEVIAAEIPETGLDQKPILAVLPFVNLSSDPKQEFFSDGLTDEMIMQLGRTDPEKLGVIARTSAMRYKGATKDVTQIGRELGVDYIIEGSARRDRKRVRITAELIRVRDQTQVWADSFERQLQDVLILQSELASAIARAVQVQLAVPIRSPVASQRRVDPDAYEACLKARFFWNRRTREDLHRALEFFAQSVEKDPNYAPAFAGLADSYLVLLDYRYVVPNEALAMAAAAAVNALRLDELLVDAHTSLAHAKLHALDWKGSEKEFRRAIQLGPGYPVVHFYYANFLTALGRFEEAIAEAREAVRLDPVSMVAEANLAILYYNASRHDEAVAACEKALQMEPNLARPHDDLGRILLEKGNFSEAIAALQKAASLSNRSARCLSSLGYGYGVAGQTDLALEILTELEGMSKQGYVASSDFAIVNAGLGNRDQAIAWLERACEERDSHLPHLNVDPRLRSLHQESRFKALLERVGL